jgi:hypothetical protein
MTKAGTRMVSRVFRGKAEYIRGEWAAMTEAATMLNEKAMKIGTPPRRGRAIACTYLS